MGVRLYPATKDVALTEQMAGVPAGTDAALKELEAPFDTRKATATDFFAREEISEELHRLLHDGEHETLADWDNFLLYGWGRLRLAPPGGWEAGECGSITDPADIDRFGAAHGLNGEVIALVKANGGFVYN